MAVLCRPNSIFGPIVAAVGHHVPMTAPAPHTLGRLGWLPWLR